jgi:hypothetical protein
MASYSSYVFLFDRSVEETIINNHGFFNFANQLLHAYIDGRQVVIGRYSKPASSRQGKTTVQYSTTVACMHVYTTTCMVMEIDQQPNSLEN